MRIEKKEFWMVLLLSIVTCGVYYYIFLYQTTASVNQMAGDDGKVIDPSLAVVFSIITCGIYDIYWFYAMGNRMKHMGDANQIFIEEDGSAYLLWAVLGRLICGVCSWVGLYLFVKNFNQLADSYNESFRLA